jgi:hypothetical protein
MQFEEDFRKSWLAYNELVIQRHGTMHRVNEQPNASALVLNLTHLNIKSSLAALVEGDADAKEHPGVRLTFVIIKMLSAGFSSFQPDGNDAGKRKAGGRGGASASNAPKERYGRMVDDSVILHSYELLNKKGVRCKGGRSEQFVVLSPGMVISSKIFGNKMQNVFGKEPTTIDINAFQFAIVQLGTTSTSSVGPEGGNLLQIRSFTPLPQYSPSSMRLIPAGIMQSSVQAATQRKEAFLAGCMVPDAQKEHANMSMIRNSLSSTFSALDVGYIDPKNGAFAVSATGTIRFHVAEPITDVTPRIIEVKYDERDFGSADVQWISKLFNVAVLLKSARMLITIDGYRNNNLELEVPSLYLASLFCGTLAICVLTRVFMFWTGPVS